MAQTINTNVASLNAQRNLSSSQGSLATSLQRLSSGLRINSAKDDAAGLAISERFGSQIRGINQAVRNANDGISLAQTAEGAMVEVGSNLQRIRELAVQSSNATNSASDREALQKEVDQLVAEIGRVAKNTEFNGTKLLDGSFANASFQVGANAGQLITVSETLNASTDSLSGATFASVTGAGAVTDVAISGLKVNDITIDDVAAQGSVASTGAALVKAINAKTDQTGVMAELDSSSKVVLTSLTTSDIVVAGSAAGDAIGSGTTAASSGTAQYVSDLDIKDVKGAQQAIAIVDEALKQVNSARASMGAVQNRFTSTIANLQTTSENLSASRGRIVDADFAAETANLTRSQILQQAGTAMLAQANGLPQNVLSLLRG